ncbi:accessory Sec system translocase SecA2 [Peribacillus cavernae]|uniref:Protein translocase subunit SecA n=1 Tax=Peribacillus cavernae TaxID=1674310 RepID=A0A3S0VRX6_9BACI|nr:accessory Sec system translocase SecA2 [Peribacillus cavernae]MDQ0218444.1 preprotein translocase subunit SecA [Peribacillus cavernae]RUQ31445.1 accessory Sec system translocase SecA2 [Peribacillus cavernae]
MISKVKKIFDDSAKDLNRLTKMANRVNELEIRYEKLSNEELKHMTISFKNRLQNGESLSDIKTEAFAVIREASKRVLGLRQYDVQLIGGFVLHEGSIAQMQTGEGKTLVATLPSYLHALECKGVHIITANEYLARRDKEQMGKVHEFLGLTVGLNISEMQPDEKQSAYASDITYGTGTEFGFDYLRDNMVTTKEDKVQRGHHYAIVDEIDSILIDEARTPLIIASKSNQGAELSEITAQLIKTFKNEKDCELFPEVKQVNLTDQGASKVEAAFGIDNLYNEENQVLLHNVMQALRAHAVMIRDVDYIVKGNKVLIIDKFTGRVMEGRTFSDGLHQAIEAKESLEITEENETQATITIQNYFRMYKTLSGMTGSATPSKKEFYDTYHLPVITVPTNRPIQRVDIEDKVFYDYESKVRYIVSEVKRLHKEERPVLIGTISIEQSEKLSDYLTKAHIKHQILNAKTEEDEARIISMAGQKGQVMLATNMAGRGTDILLGEEVRELGGLHIIGTERHESNRIDMQLRGRAGRQGDSGSSQFSISLDDDLFTYYDEDDFARFKKKVKINEEGIVISPDPLKFVEKVQETIESNHFSARNHLLKLDNTADQQSKIIYSMRDRLLELEGPELFAELHGYMHNFFTKTMEIYCTANEEEWNVKGMIEELPFHDWREEEIQEMEREEISDKIITEFEKLKTNTLELKDDETIVYQLKRLMLQQIDSNWIQYLDAMTELKEGNGLRGYAQEDPYRIFEFEALEGFNQLLHKIYSKISIQFIENIRSQHELNITTEEELFNHGTIS